MGWWRYNTDISEEMKQSGVQKDKNKNLRKTAVLTWFLWTLLAFVETPGCPNGPTALLLLCETWQSLPTLTHTDGQ